jgi:hypothetical protein
VGEDGELNAVAEGEFVEEFGDVGLDGGFAESEMGGDLGVGQALATARRTSVSRGVSWSRMCGDSGVGLAGRCTVTRRRVTAASSRTSPSATARTAAMSERRGVSLSRKPLAPARSALRTASSRSKVVSARTWQCGTAARTRRVASMPSSRGIRTYEHDVGLELFGHGHRVDTVGGLTDDVDVGLGGQDHGRICEVP